jgi:hypothetical protein
MHNDTPLGAMMHLKELDRQAAPKLIPMRAGGSDASPLTCVWAAMKTLLRRLHAVGIPERARSQGSMYPSASSFPDQGR